MTHQFDLNWTPTPSKYSKPLGLKLFSSRGKLPTAFLVLGRQVHGILLHWDGRQETPCTQTESRSCDPRPGRSHLPTCKHCSEGRSIRWKGYLYGIAHGRSKPCVLVVTEGMFWQMRDMVDEPSELRGVELRMYRDGPRPNSPVKVELVRRRDPGELPEEIDPRILLVKMWGCIRQAPAGWRGVQDAANGVSDSFRGSEDSMES